MAVVQPLDTSWGSSDAKLLVTLEDNVLSGGFGEMFSAAFMDSGSSILNIAVPDRFVEHGDIASLRKECGIDAASIAEKVKEKLGSK